jgi:hypothetical protein
VAAWRRLKTNFSIFADFAGRYVAKMTGKSVFSDKITGKKGGLFCRRLFFEKPFFPKNTTHKTGPCGHPESEKTEIPFFLWPIGRAALWKKT